MRFRDLLGCLVGAVLAVAVAAVIGFALFVWLVVSVNDEMERERLKAQRELEEAQNAAGVFDP